MDQPTNVDLRGAQGAIIGASGDITQTFTVTEERSYDVSGLPTPYLGLRAFTYQDRAAFAGRQRAVDEAARQLTVPGARLTLVFITGASGSGKSSFAQAGLIPALEAYYAQRDRQTRHAVFTPSRDPLVGLRDALEQLGLPAEQSALATALLHTPPKQVNVLVIDQFEECFTQSLPDARQGLFDWLAALPPFDEGRTHIIATLRADYLNELFEVSALWEAAKQHGVELRAMTVDELREAIQCPLQAAYSAGDERYRDKHFQPALVDRLAQDAAEDAAYLPLLQITLEELWKKGKLILAHYDKLTDAIEQRAEQVLAYEDFDTASPHLARPPDAQAAILNAFLDLVDVSLDNDARRDVRRRRAKRQLEAADPRRERLIEDLTRARLLSISTQANVEMVDIIHESLIANWDRLREQVAESRRRLQKRARFEQNLARWTGHEQADAYLLDGVDLAEARELDAASDIALKTPEAQELLKRSADREQAEQRQELERLQALAEAQQQRLAAEQQGRRRARTFVVVLSVIAAVALAAFGWALIAQRQAQAGETAARQARATAVSEEQAALAARATVVAERNISRALEAAFRAGSAIRLDPELSLLLAISATTSLQGRDTGQALREAVAASHIRRTLRGHSDTVYSVAYNRDGTRLLTASEDRTARVWDTATGRETLRLTGHTAAVRSAVFSPDDRRIATASADETVRLWDAATGAEMAVLGRGVGKLNTVAFDRAGQRLVTAGDDGRARVWDLPTGREVRTIQVMAQGRVRSAEFNPDGRQILTAGDDAALRLWDAATGTPLGEPIYQYDSALANAAYSPDGRRIVVTNLYGYAADVWDVESRAYLGGLSGQHTWLIQHASFSPDGAYIVTTSSDKTARIWDVHAANSDEWRVITTLRGHSGEVWRAAFSPDGQSVATAGDQTARVWSPNPDHELLFYPNHDADTGVFRARYSPDGGQIAIVDWDGVRLWDASAPRQGLRLSQPYGGRIAFDPSGRRLAVATRDSAAMIWDTTTGARVATLVHPENAVVRAANFSPDGKLIVTSGGNPDGSGVFVRLWDAATYRPLRSFEGHQGWVAWAVFSPDGQRILSSGADGTARVWDTQTGALLLTLTPTGVVGSAKFSPDGRTIVTASTDQFARVWDATTGQLLRVLSGHESEVADVAISPDGQFIATASSDRTARLWEAATGREVATLRGHTEAVQTVDFSPDGQRLLTAGADGARVYLVQAKDVLSLAQGRVSRLFTCEERVEYLRETLVCPTPTP